MLTIVTGKDKAILHQKAEPVTSFDKKLKNLIKEMIKAVDHANGVGLAAPQVNISKRLFLAKIKDRFIPMINPEITSYSEEKEVAEEGCLSLPDVWGNVERSKHITVNFQDLSGNEQTLKLSDLEARIVQHEYDHIEGTLFIDKLYNPIGSLPQSNEMETL